MPSVDELRARIEPSLMRCLAELAEPVLRALVGDPVVIDGQLLDLETQLFLKRVALIGGPELQTLSTDEARAQVVRSMRILAGPPLELSVEQIEITGPAGPLPARLYTPEGTTEAGPLLVYYHGGGCVICDLDTHDPVCRFLAQHDEVRVVSIDYRLAPEHHFPAAPEDAFAAFRYVADHGAELGADQSRIAVGGDSAGGNLAARVAQRAAREAARSSGPVPIFQLLIYPWMDLSSKRRSHDLFEDGFYISPLPSSNGSRACTSIGPTTSVTRAAGRCSPMR